MSDTKPVDLPAAGPIAAAPVSDALATSTESAPAAEATTTTTEPTAAEHVSPAVDETTALPVEVKKGNDEVRNTADPMYSGSLGYKAPGLLKSLTYSKKFFWFGEEPISKDRLSAYLRGEKAEVSHSTVAWASKTGKGLLLFAKNAEQKASPAGVLKLADVSDVTKEGNVAFFFKLHNHKHQFEALTQAERDGWIVSIEKSIEEAKAASEEVTGSDDFKATLEALAKPTAAAAAATASISKPDESVSKKSSDFKSAERAQRPSSTSSSDENAKNAKNNNTTDNHKSRSVSRKRASVFGLLGKKETKKEEEPVEAVKDEPKPEGELAPTTEGAAAEPIPDVAAADEIKPAEEAKPVESEAPAVVPEIKPTPTPKVNKRTSIFGNFFEKVRSPVYEKKESDVVPTVPPKDTEVVAAPAENAADVAAATATVAEPAAAPADSVVETAETKLATTPTPIREKSGFFSKFGNKKKEVESPAIESPAAVETRPEEPAAAAAVTPTVESEAPPAPKAASEFLTKEKRRTSFFGNLGVKISDNDGERKKGLGGLFRNPSKAVKSNKEREVAPAKVEEESEAKANESKAEDKIEEPKAEETTVSEEDKPTIGDVVPDAIQVRENQATPTVQATA